MKFLFARPGPDIFIIESKPPNSKSLRNQQKWVESDLPVAVVPKTHPLFEHHWKTRLSLLFRVLPDPLLLGGWDRRFPCARRKALLCED